jgi:hypothetical protein
LKISLPWKKGWLPILFMVLLLRVIYSALGWLVASGPLLEPLAGGPVYDFTAPLLSSGPFMEKLINIWWRWDTPYYLSIAAQGYSIERTQAYLPLYPVLISWMRPLAGGNYMASSLLVSSLSALAAGILLYEVALAEGWTESEAFASTVSMFMFPTAFFLFAGYTEALFIALTLSAWLLARRQRWVMSGLAGALAALTRLSGVSLTPVLLWMFLVDCAGAQGSNFSRQAAQVLKRGFNCLARPAWLATLLPAVCLGLYLLWTRRIGPGAPYNILATYWGIQTVPPWEGFRLFLNRLFFTPRVFIDWIDVSLFTIVLAVSVYGLFRLDPALSLYSWLNLGLLMMRGTPPHMLDSFSRYLLVIFPVFLVFGRAGNRLTRTVRTVGWAVSFTLQLLLTWAFLQWRWVA